jgi:glycosyltransferase involved in cell wall biosynthesis
MLKILHIIPNLGKGGAERLVLDICNQLYKTHGVEVKLICFSDKNEYPSLAVADYIKVIPASVNLSVLGKNSFKIEGLQKELDNFQPDIIHTHLFEAEIVSRSCLYSRAKWFSHCHNNMEQFNNFSKQTLVQKTFFTNYIEKKFLFNRYMANGGNHFIAISNNTRTFYKKTVKKFPITLLPNAIDYDRFYNPNVEEKNKKSLTLINVGSLLKNKNQIFLFEIIKILIKTNISVELILLGEGENRHQLESGIKKYRLENQIKLLGAVDNVEDYLNKADMYVHSAISEAMGLTILEAMAAGLPVITLDGKGNRDLIEQGKNGYMIYEQNPELFAQTIIDLWNDKQKYREMSAFAKEFAKQYDIKNYINKLLNLYQNNIE